jgi:hypothetical protein
MRHVLGLHILAFLAAPPLVAQESVEELPPPRSETSVLVQPPRDDQDRRPASWRLVGPVGQYYFVESSVLADYLRGDQRHIVALEWEDPSSHPSPDPNFLYFREPDGPRGAFASTPRMPAPQARGTYFSGHRETGTGNQSRAVATST